MAVTSMPWTPAQAPALSGSDCQEGDELLGVARRAITGAAVEAGGRAGHRAAAGTGAGGRGGGGGRGGAARRRTGGRGGRQRCLAQRGRGRERVGHVDAGGLEQHLGLGLVAGEHEHGDHAHHEQQHGHDPHDDQVALPVVGGGGGGRGRCRPAPSGTAGEAGPSTRWRRDLRGSGGRTPRRSGPRGARLRRRRGRSGRSRSVSRCGNGNRAGAAGVVIVGHDVLAEDPHRRPLGVLRAVLRCWGAPRPVRWTRAAPARAPGSWWCRCSRGPCWPRSSATGRRTRCRSRRSRPAGPGPAGRRDAARPPRRR